MKGFWAVAFAAALLCFTAPARAVELLTPTFTAAGQEFTWHFIADADGTVVIGSAVDLNVELTNINNSLWTFDFNVDNHSTSPTTALRVVSFGFNTTPTVLQADVVSGTVFTTPCSGSISLGHTVEFGVTSGPNCAGGANGGVLIGSQASGSFQLLLPALTTSLTFDDAFGHAQSITNTSQNLQGVSALLRPGVPPNAVPEPASWALMILGLGGVGALLRRKRAIAALA